MAFGHLRLVNHWLATETEQDPLHGHHNVESNELAGDESVIVGSKDVETTEDIVYAPGINKTRVSPLSDTNAELLTFLHIYCGQPRRITVKASSADMAKSELRRSFIQSNNIASFSPWKYEIENYNNKTNTTLFYEGCKRYYVKYHG